MPETKRKGDYYLDCSEDVYFRAPSLLTSHRIRHCEEKSQWMQMRMETRRRRTRRRKRSRRREVEECC